MAQLFDCWNVLLDGQACSNCTSAVAAHVMLVADDGPLDAQLLAKFVDDDGDAAAVLRCQDVPDQCRLAGAQKACRWIT